MLGTPNFAQPPHTAVAAAIQRSFRTWATNDTKYKRTFKKLDTTALELVDAALSEMYEYKPYAYHHWWCHQHKRFDHVKSEKTRLVYELLFEFLSRFDRGELETNAEKRTDNPKRKKFGRASTAKSQ